MLAVLVAVFILIRPWNGRLITVLVAGALVAAVVAYVAPLSVTQWNKQEALTAFRLRTETFPFSDHFYACGEASAHFGTGTPQAKEYSLFSSLTQGSPTDSGCDRLELWEGWRRVRVINLATGQWAAEGITSGFETVSVNEGAPLAKTTFTVQTQSGKKSTYSLAKLLAQ
jgi:hypothetical protein